MTQFRLKPLELQTQFAPLCMVGYYYPKSNSGHQLAARRALEPLQQVEIPQKRVKHHPADTQRAGTGKLLDCLIGILTGCSALYQINEKVRPDKTLQRAFGREDCAEQSTFSETLDACTRKSISQLRKAIETMFEVSLPQDRTRPEEITDWEEIGDRFLLIDLDLTGLPASPNAEGSTKGHSPRKRNQTGRQELRVSVPQYGEVL